MAKQTKNFADIARLNSAISDGEKKAAQLYASLGELNYNAHRQDARAPERGRDKKRGKKWNRKSCSD